MCRAGGDMGGLKKQEFTRAYKIASYIISVTSLGMEALYPRLVGGGVGLKSSTLKIKD